MTKKTVGIAVAVIFGLGILFLSFMDGVRPTAVAEAAGKKPAGHGAAPADAPKPGAAADAKFEADKLPKVVATVDKTVISRDLYTRIMKNVLADMSARGEALTEEKLTAVKSKVLEHLINSEVLYNEAVVGKVPVDEKQVEAQYEGIKSRFPSEDEFKKSLSDQSITLMELKQDIRKNFAIRTLIEDRVLNAIKVSEAEAKKYYDENKDKFQVPEMVRARHIILRLEPTADDKKKADAAKKMEEIQGKLKAGGKFEDLAKEYSEDGSKAKGGDLGFFPKGVMVKEFEEAAWAMKPGETSKVLTTQFGLHLIKLEEKKEAGIATFEDSKADVIRGLESEAKRAKVVKFIADLKAKAKIKINL